MHAINRIVLFVVSTILCACTSRHHAFPVATGAVGEVAQVRPEHSTDFGSTRNSRVAIAVDGRTEPLVFLTGAIAPEDLNEVKEIAPNIQFITGLNRQSALEHAAKAHAADVSVLSPELLEKAPNLVWIMAFSAGVDRYLSIESLRKNDKIILTNMRAVHGPAIADHAMAMLLHHTRNLGFYSDHQKAAHWNAGETPWSSSALAGRTMLVVGLGGIGAEVARRAHGFGMNVIATRRSQTAAPEFVSRVGSPEDLAEMLPQADVVAICVPLTSETEGLFDEAMIGKMKPGSILINIARGKIVKTDALVAALNRGHLAGACLDVTEPEPLPANHPLWKMKQVVITPHVAGDAELTMERHQALMRENLRRFSAGEPLLNVVDKAAGY